MEFPLPSASVSSYYDLFMKGMDFGKLRRVEAFEALDVLTFPRNTDLGAWQSYGKWPSPGDVLNTQAYIPGNGMFAIGQVSVAPTKFDAVSYPYEKFLIQNSTVYGDQYLYYVGIGFSAFFWNDGQPDPHAISLDYEIPLLHALCRHNDPAERLPEIEVEQFWVSPPVTCAFNYVRFNIPPFGGGIPPLTFPSWLFNANAQVYTRK